MNSIRKYRRWPIFKSQTQNLLSRLPDDFGKSVIKITREQEKLKKELLNTSNPFEKDAINFMINNLEDIKRMRKTSIKV